jgi:ATP-dependent DNA helicase RecG
VLAFLIENPACTYQELADKLSVNRKTAYIRIKSLKDKGIIRRVGSDTKGHWEIVE